MQKLVDSVNKFPQNDTYVDFLTKSEGIEEDLEQVKTDLRQVIDDIMDIRVGLFEQNGCIDLSKKNFNTRKRHLDDDDVYIDKLWKDISEINDV
jgi:protein AATF/BFR2